jgi:hypothetical protein
VDRLKMDRDILRCWLRSVEEAKKVQWVFLKHVSCTAALFFGPK